MPKYIIYSLIILRIEQIVCIFIIFKSILKYVSVLPNNVIMKSVISSRLVGYKHIHMLNGYSFPKDKKTIFKYMPIDRFIQSVDDMELVFVSPEMWYDPFEQLYYGIDCSNKGYTTEDIACMCASEKSSTNEDACWRVYAGTNTKTVRISLEQDKLLRVLDKYALNYGYEVYIGKVNYAFEKQEIKNLYKPSSTHYAKFFPDTMSREHYLSLMLLKRKSFQYENEIRIFLVKDNIKFDNGLLKIPCNYTTEGLVSNVILSPYPPIRTNGDIAVAVRNKMNQIESEEIKKVLRAKVGCSIQQSLLYQVCERIKQVL